MAAGWPEKPVQLIVPYPPGGNVDSAARIIAPGLEKALGQPVVIETRAGAGGMIAAEHVTKSAPDGYTLFMAANGPLLFSPMTFGREDAYNWKVDFVPISSVSLTPMVLNVRADLGIKTIGELLEKLKTDKLLMASPGAGTTNHLAAELLKEIVGIDWRIVHYKGNAPAVASLLGGETAFAFDQLSVSLPHIKDGKVVPLVVTSKDRDASLPDVPTLSETGTAKFQAVTFTGVLGPKGTPGDIVTKMNEALTQVLADPDVMKRFNDLGATAKAMTPDEFTAFLTDIDDTWRPVVKAVNDAKKQ
jgi:tripartite-type tricarboxylate transporter receptor subunit TctC